MLFLNAIYLAGEERRKWGAEIPGQRRGTDDGTVVKLDLAGKARGLALALFLETDDCVDERGIKPRFEYATGLRSGDDVGCRLFDYGEAVEIELANHRCLA